MIIRYLKKQEAAAAIQEWRDSGKKLPQVDPEYESIREDICNLYEKVKTSSTYKTDVSMGLEIYDYFQKKEFFSMRVAANDDFWRYLSVKVVPHIVADRWGDENDDHIWKINVRIWLRSIWWYIHLSWRGSIEKTKTFLISPVFSTDTILNLEERSGRRGTFIDVYRLIMYYYSRIPPEIIDRFNLAAGKSNALFRNVMKLNTARTMILDPALYLGGEQEYVKSLFAEVGCSL